MTKRFIGHDWHFFQKTGINKFIDLPEMPCVYLILVRYCKFKRAIIAYIGQTKSIRKRISCHVVFQTLQRCQHDGGYTIEVLYKNFGDDNVEMERKLLNTYKPPFDGVVDGYSALKRYNRYLFWQTVGVQKVNTSKHKWAKDKYSVAVYLKKYKKVIENKRKFSRFHKGY